MMSAWQLLVTWVLVLGGWYVIHLATLSRERRKERRDAAKLATDALSNLAVEAREFHSASTFDPDKLDLLIYKTQRIIRSLQRMPLRDLDLSILKMVRLRKSISLTNTDSSSFATQNTLSPFLLEIRAATDELIDAIEERRETRWA